LHIAGAIGDIANRNKAVFTISCQGARYSADAAGN
jgi:hypothetical protein